MDRDPGDVLPAGFSARTTVHEYGGAPFAVRNGTVWFSNFDDQRVYRIDPGAEPVPVTPEPATRWAERYADLQVSPDGHRVAAVRERHLENGDVVNDVVLLTGDGRVEAVAAGHDFYAAPRFAPTGSLAWLSWDHPNMPWDGTELWLERAAAPTAGGPDESVSQPRWGPDGVLHWISDASGWWNVYRNGERLAPADAELGGPDWVFGQSTYAPLPGDLVVAAKVGPGLGELWLVDDGTPTTLPTPYTSFSSVTAYGDDAVVAIAASAKEAPAVVSITVRGDAKGEIEVLRRSREANVDPGYLSTPRAITFPTEDGLTAHALYYPPANQDFDGAGRRRAAAAGGDEPRRADVGGVSALNLTTQYFTSRGLAVVDVDYGGSTGYGREYRRRLDGQWGVVDVADCVERRPPPGRRRRGRRPPPGHPRRQRRRLHHPVRPHLHRRVRGRRQLLRRGRPGVAGHRHPQVRVPLPRPAGRPVARGGDGLPASAPRSTPPTGSRRR